MELTFGDVLDLLDLTATATHQVIDGKDVKIEGKLEEARIRDVKALEDMLVETMKGSNLVCGGINYIRKYEHMYKHLQ